MWQWHINGNKKRIHFIKIVTYRTFKKMTLVLSDCMVVLSECSLNIFFVLPAHFSIATGLSWVFFVVLVFEILLFLKSLSWDGWVYCIHLHVLCSLSMRERVSGLLEWMQLEYGHSRSDYWWKWCFNVMTHLGSGHEAYYNLAHTRLFAN